MDEIEIENVREEHVFTVDQKLCWFGYGEWVEEIDKIFFKHKNIECAIKRIVIPEPYNPKHIFGGHLCGYVRIPTDHPYYQKKIDDLDIDCHGGLTYAECIDDEYWVGFDCGHSGDYLPSINFSKIKNKKMLNSREIFPHPPEFEKFSIFNPVYRNIKFCVDECKSIVDQLSVNAEIEE